MLPLCLVCVRMSVGREKEERKDAQIQLFPPLKSTLST